MYALCASRCLPGTVTLLSKDLIDQSDPRTACGDFLSVDMWKLTWSLHQVAWIHPTQVTSGLTWDFCTKRWITLVTWESNLFSEQVQSVLQKQHHHSWKLPQTSMRTVGVSGLCVYYWWTSVINNDATVFFICSFIYDPETGHLHWFAELWM